MTRDARRQAIVRRNRSLAVNLLVLAGYTILTVIFTFPLVLHLGTHVVGRNGDVEQYIWSFWWMRKALQELHTNPFLTHWLYYPDGVSLRFFASDPAHAFFSIVLQDAFGLLSAYNLMSLLTFLATAMATYWLALDISGSRPAAFVGGMVFAFAPTQVFHFDVGQANLHSVEFLPVYVLCVRRWLLRGGPRWLFGAVAALVLSSLCNWEFAVYLALVTALLLLGFVGQRWRLWRAALWTLGRRSAALGVLYLVLITPLIVPMVQELRDPQHYMVRPRYDTLVHSADLLAAFVPNPLHPLWRAWGEQLNARLHTEGVLVTTVSLSYVALGLALVGARRQWQRARFWVVCGMIFWVLSLGPQLQVLGRMTAIHLPYELLFQLKVIQISRAPARYMIPAELCLAILAAVGTQSLQGTPARFGQRVEGHQDRRDSRWLLAVIILALSLELLPAPARVTPPAPTPSFFVDGTLRNAGALLEVPNPSNVGMYYATLHGRPVLYGELSRDNPATPLVEYLRHGYWRDEIMAANMQNWECVAGFFDVTHAVIYHVDKPEVEVATAALQERLGSVALVRDTPEATLYQLPTSATRSSDTCLVLGAGWGTPRPFGADQPVYRWAGQQASLEVLQPTPGRIRLHFMAHSFGHARQLQVRVGDQLAGQFTVGVSPQPLAVEFDVPAGRTLVELHSVEPATVPADFGFPETEPVTIGFSQMQAEVED